MAENIVVNGTTYENVDAIVVENEQGEEVVFSQGELGGAVDSVNGKTGVVVLNAADIGADPSGTAATAVSGHDTNEYAHNDIRVTLDRLSVRLNTLFDSEDVDLDQLSEIIAYIKSNRTLIDSVTTGKVSVSDIVNNLTTNVANRTLSAAQGVVLKNLHDALDRVFTTHSQNSDIHITSAERAIWNAKANQSDIDILMGSYLLNGEEKTLTVGIDIQIGQVINFYYLPSVGYTWSAFKSDPINMSRNDKAPIAAPAGKYASDSITVGDFDTYTFTGVYSDISANLSEEIENLKSSGIVIVQDGNTLTVNSGGEE